MVEKRRLIVKGARVLRHLSGFLSTLDGPVESFKVELVVSLRCSDIINATSDEGRAGASKGS